MGRPEDIRLSFNEAPEIYDRVRPSYPDDLFDALFQMLPSQPEIVEVGPGTGKATKDLLARGASVVAVEIGEATAAKLRSNLPTDRLRITIDDFELLEIGGEVDAVFSASAYHWISREGKPIAPPRFLDQVGSWRLWINSSRLAKRCWLLRRGATDLRTIWTGPHRSSGAQA